VYREDARKSLILALKEIDVRGDIRTTVEYLIQLLGECFLTMLMSGLAYLVPF